MDIDSLVLKCKASCFPNWHETQSKFSVDTESNKPLESKCCTQEEDVWPSWACQNARERIEETAATGNSECGSRRQRMCRDGSHRLDTLSVSNHSSRNGNSWFVALIARLNIMAKTFAKMFIGLLAMIVAKGRRLVLILHLEAKYAKIDCKNEIYAKNWVRSTWTKKSTPGQSQRSA